MRLAKSDLHAVYSRSTNRLKLFESQGILLLSIECRNKTVRDDGNYGHWSPCPPGTFLLGQPALANTVPFGKWFVSMNDWSGCQAMKAYRRSGIGLHGGGSGLSQPFAPYQSPPWVITHGCLRCRNRDLETVVREVKEAQAHGGKCYITVEAPMPGSPMSLEDDYLDIPIDQLAPGE